MTSSIANDPAICAACAVSGSSCCQVASGQEEFCFPISRLEMDRILDYGPQLGGFAPVANSEAFRDSLFKLFPQDRARIDKLFPVKGEHFRLATGEDGSCAFLTSSGCCLPREVRPYYCRMFPLWMAGRGLTLFMSKSCRLSAEAGNVSRALKLLGCPAGQARELFGRLRLAWGLEPL